MLGPVTKTDSPKIYTFQAGKILRPKNLYLILFLKFFLIGLVGLNIE
jgi:hypothetical protein